MSQTLEQLLNETERIALMLIGSDGELTPEIEALLAENDLGLKQKVDSYCGVIESLKLKVAYSTGRMKEWEKVLSACERSIDNLTLRLKHGLERMHLADVSGLEFSARLQANPPRVDIVDESKLPGEFLITKTVTTTMPDKKLIKEAIEDSRDVPGAKLVRSSRVVIKTSTRKELPAPKKAVVKV